MAGSIVCLAWLAPEDWGLRLKVLVAGHRGYLSVPPSRPSADW